MNALAYEHCGEDVEPDSRTFPCLDKVVVVEIYGGVSVGVVISLWKGWKVSEMKVVDILLILLGCGDNAHDDVQEC